VNTDILDSRLHALRSELDTVHAPPALESVLASQFRRTHGKRPTLWWMPPLALAATLGVVSWMVRVPHAVAPAVQVALADPGPFIALRPLERIALEPSPTVVETEFPRALLADWGLPVEPDRAAEPVRAQLLYSPDGEALAVRLIN
jgi:hypothetical protein